MRGIVVASIAIVAVLAAAAVAFARTHTDDERGFSFDLPDAWRPIGREQLDEMNARVESAYRGSRLVAGYYLASKEFTSAPYFVVQVTQTNLEGLDYDEVAEKLDIDPNSSSAYRAHTQSAHLISRMQMRRAALDRDNNRFVFQGPAGAPPVGNLVRSSVGFLANDGVVTLHCYALSRDAETVRPVFDTVIASFRFRPGVAYQESSDSVSFWGVVLRVLAIAAVLAFAAGFVKSRLDRVTFSGHGRRRRGPRLFAARYRLR